MTPIERSRVVVAAAIASGRRPALTAVLDTHITLVNTSNDLAAAAARAERESLQALARRMRRAGVS